MTIKAEIDPKHLTNLRIKQKNLDSNTDVAYTTGFKLACDRHGVDPMRIIRIAHALELHL